MANLIDTTYFIRDINLPGNVLSGDYADITTFITRYEKEALIDLLGYTLYKALKTEIDSSPQTFTTKWDRLVNGHEYEIEFGGDTHTIKWNGLINSDKISLIAYYVFYQYVRYHVTHSTKIGEVISLSENAVKISPVQRMVNAWNQFIRLRGSTTEPRITPTAYNFLLNFEDDESYGYDAWLFNVFPETNTFGI